MNPNEPIIEYAVLGWFGESDCPVGHGAAFAGLRRAVPSLAPGERAAKRDSLGEVVSVGRLRAVRRLNQAISQFRTLATLLPKLLSGELSGASIESKVIPHA